MSRVHKTIGGGVIVDAPGDLDGDPGIVMPYHDAPEDEPISHADAAHALERITEQISGILMLRGRDPDLCERDAQLIRHVWTNALRAST